MFTCSINGWCVCSWGIGLTIVYQKFSCSSLELDCWSLILKSHIVKLFCAIVYIFFIWCICVFTKVIDLIIMNYMSLQL